MILREIPGRRKACKLPEPAPKKPPRDPSRVCGRTFEDHGLLIGKHRMCYACLRNGHGDRLKWRHVGKLEFWGALEDWMASRGFWWPHSKHPSLLVLGDCVCDRKDCVYRCLIAYRKRHVHHPTVAFWFQAKPLRMNATELPRSRFMPCCDMLSSLAISLTAVAASRSCVNAERTSLLAVSHARLSHGWARITDSIVIACAVLTCSRCTCMRFPSLAPGARRPGSSCEK
jgi:hypothetical protein